MRHARFYLLLGIAGILSVSNASFGGETQEIGAKPFRLTGSRSAPVHVYADKEGKMMGQTPQEAQIRQNAGRLNQTQIETAKRLDDSKKEMFLLKIRNT